MCCTGLCKFPPQRLDLGVKLAGIHRQFDALLLGIGKLGPQLGVLRHQLQEHRLGDDQDAILGRAVLEVEVDRLARDRHGSVFRAPALGERRNDAPLRSRTREAPTRQGRGF